MILSGHGHGTLRRDTLSDREADRFRYYLGEYPMFAKRMASASTLTDVP